MVPEGQSARGGRVGETYGRDLMILRRSLGATRLQLLANKSFTFLNGCGRLVSDVHELPRHRELIGLLSRQRLEAGKLYKSM